jgi:two-component system, cell cycle response regulator
MTARILVVDDIEANVKLLKLKLIKRYYEVLTASNGLEAIEILEHQQVDLILLDVNMPIKNGFDTCLAIKSNPKTFHIPVIMVTALNETEDRLKGLEVGADDFITKPIIDVVLFARIKSLIRLKELIDDIRQYHSMKIEEISSYGLLDDANILLIDDDIVSINLIKQVFNPSRLTNIALDEDIDGYLNNNLDLIIINANSLVIDPLRICVKILNNDNTQNVPILSIIEQGDYETLVKALDLGVNDYLADPINKEEIRARSITQIKRKKFQDALGQHIQDNINLAQIDGLTGLYNRNYFHNKLLEEMSFNKILSLVILDLDYFKKINDVYGHLVGDKLLQHVAQTIKNNLRSKDVLARFGGEEFILLLPANDLNTAYLIADRIRKLIEATAFYIGEQKEISITASFGVAMQLENELPESLIDRADKALYIAKETGRNKVIKA